MNRLFSIAALLLSLCALLVTFWLWHDMRRLRMASDYQPSQTRLTDEQFAKIKDFAGFIHTSFDESKVPRFDVLTADELLVKARFMHGDISQEEWHRLSNEAEGERMRLGVARLKAGAGTIADILLIYDDVLESSR